MVLLQQFWSTNKIISRRLITSKAVFKNNGVHTNNALPKLNIGGIVKLDIHGKPFNFPSVWLRDNCQCEQCFHRSAKSRILDWSKFNVSVKTKSILNDDTCLQITWDDGHASRYDLKWLKFRSFTPEDQMKYTNTLYRPVKIPWHGSDFHKICKKYDYNAILNGDVALYNWLHDISTYGVALIQNAPQSENATERIVKKIGFSKRTHYGDKFFVENVVNPNNVAFWNSKLQMHVDAPYYEYTAGVTMLHCFAQTLSQGGENLLSDCHYTVSYMRKHHPEQYKLLTDTEVEWSDVGIEHDNEFFKLYRSPVICLDKHGDVKRVNFSIPQRGSHFPGTIENVKPWYEAYSLFYELNNKFAAKFKTETGDILVFDNIRFIHGRNEYEDNPNNVRKVIGTFVDWDEIYSRLRCLKAKLYPEEGM